MAWECPKCGEKENDESVLRCMECGGGIEEQALDHKRVTRLRDDINRAATGDVTVDWAGQAAVLYTRTNSIKAVAAELGRAGLPADQAMEVANQVYSAKVGLNSEASNKNALRGGVISASPSPVFPFSPPCRVAWRSCRSDLSSPERFGFSKAFVKEAEDQGMPSRPCGLNQSTSAVKTAPI